MRVLIIGDSGGIGSALAQHMASRGADVVGRSRGEHGLDVTREASVQTQMDALEGTFDQIWVTTGALEIDGAQPEKTLRALDPAAMEAQFRLNALGPALILKHGLRLLPRGMRSVFAALSARVGSIGDNRLGGWVSYRSSKAALNQILHTAAIEMGRSHPRAICVALHPGTVATPFTRKYVGRHPAVPPETAAQNLVSVVENLTPDDSGGFYDWTGAQVPW